VSVYDLIKLTARVSNFSVKNLSELLSTAKIVPAVNQVESHPYLPQQSLDRFCRDKGIILTAYSPLGQPREGKKLSPLLTDDKVVELAKKYNVEPGTVSRGQRVSAHRRFSSLGWRSAQAGMSFPSRPTLRECWTILT
jgi:aryl-alcohol dehydrogenase-like predicted oxidoreductase